MIWTSEYFLQNSPISFFVQLNFEPYKSLINDKDYYLKKGFNKSFFMMLICISINF